jgi:hypothetical protein
MDARTMSEPEAQHEVTPGAPGGQDQLPRREPPPRGKKPNSSRRTLIGIVGGLLITGIAGVVILPNIVRDKPPVVGEESTLEVLAPGEINLALPTLDPGTSKTAVDDAKNCKVPLAWVTLTQRNGHGGMVRIRSGQYLSPPIKLTPAPQRVAVPYPAPYPTGRGVLTLVGEADQVGFYLTPGGVHDVNGTYPVNVHWQVRNPCP